MAELTEILHGSAEWHEARRTKVNASTASAILYPGYPGVRGTPLSEYHRIVDGKHDEPDADLLKLFNWGNRSEPLHIEMLSDDMEGDWLIVANKRMVRHEKFEWLVGTPDALGTSGDGRKGVFELKAPVYHEPWGDNCPTGPETQCRLYMMMMDADVGYVSALIPPEVKVYEVKRDKDWEAWALSVLEEFWTKHVLEKVPPPARPADAKLLSELHRTERKQVYLSDELLRKMQHMEGMKLQVADLESCIADYRTELLQSMGDAEIAKFSDGTGYSYLSQTRKTPAKEASVSTFRVLKRMKP